MSRGLTDEQYAAQYHRVERFIERWVPILGLADWKIILKGDASGEMAAEYGDTADSPVASLMDCGPSWEYMQAHIRVNLIEAQNTDDDELEESVIHELCHILVCELRPEDATAEDHFFQHEERVVTMLARAFVRVREREAA